MLAQDTQCVWTVWTAQMVNSVRKRCGTDQIVINSIDIGPTSNPVTPRPATTD